MDFEIVCFMYSTSRCCFHLISILVKLLDRINLVGTGKGYFSRVSTDPTARSHSNAHWMKAYYPKTKKDKYHSNPKKNK